MKRTQIFAVLLVLLPAAGHSQLTVSGQLRTRTEFRNGVGTLRPKDAKPAFFTSQRSRISLQHKWNQVVFRTTVQDVRVWGQDASTISATDGNRLMVHEAWAEIILDDKNDSAIARSFADYFSIKIGRQELLYDDSRLLGNLDWLQQARRHDAIVFRLLQKGWQVDLGAAFNQHTDAFGYNGTLYTPANVTPQVRNSQGHLVPTPAGMIPVINAEGISAPTGTLSLAGPVGTNGLNQHYKAMQFLYVAKTLGNARTSLLLLGDQFAKYAFDSVTSIVGADTGFVYGRRYNQAGVHARFTGGILSAIPLTSNKQWTLTAGAWYQFGKDKEGLKLAAWTGTAALAFTKNKFSCTAGYDYVSGNDGLKASSVNHRFDPLYGTPHKFWGYMDYFYAGTGSPAGGLSNPYIRIRYDAPGKRFTTGLDYHYFALANNQRNKAGAAVNKYLGSEIDWVSTYALNKITTLEWGLAFLAATESMDYAKNVEPGSARRTAQWTYLQINITPVWAGKQ